MKHFWLHEKIWNNLSGSGDVSRDVNFTWNFTLSWLFFPGSILVQEIKPPDTKHLLWSCSTVHKSFEKRLWVKMGPSMTVLVSDRAWSVGSFQGIGRAGTVAYQIGRAGIPVWGLDAKARISKLCIHQQTPRTLVNPPSNTHKYQNTHTNAPTVVSAYTIITPLPPPHIASIKFLTKNILPNRDSKSKSRSRIKFPSQRKEQKHLRGNCSWEQ